MLIRWLKAPNSKVVISFEESFNLKKEKQSDKDEKTTLSKIIKPFEASESDKCVH